MAEPDAKRLRDLLLDFYLQHDPEKLKMGLDINGIVLWTGRNGIDALNEVLRNQTGHILDLNKNLGTAQQKAQRISTVFNPSKKVAKSAQQNERELLSRIHYFYMRNDRDKLINVHKIHKYTLYHGEDKLNERLMAKYGKILPKELPNVQQMKQNPENFGGVTVKRIESATPESAMKLAMESAQRDSFRQQAPPEPVKRRRKRKGQGGEAPPLPPKSPQKQLPPLPPKTPKGSKPLPALPSQRIQSQDFDDGISIMDDDYQDDEAELELREYFDYHDPEVIDGIDEYLDLYAQQGRVVLNQRLEQIYGENLDNFLTRNEQMKRMPQESMDFVGSGGASVNMSSNYDRREPQGSFEFMGTLERSRKMKEDRMPQESMDFVGSGGPSVNLRDAEDDYGFGKTLGRQPPELPPKSPKSAPPLPPKSPKSVPPLPPKNRKKKGKLQELPPLPDKDPEDASFDNISSISGGSPKKLTAGQNSQQQRSRLLQNKINGGGGRKMIKSISMNVGSLMKSMKNMAAGNRFSLAPNANVPEVSSPMEATPEAGACGNYRLDMLGSSIGICVCGFSRAEHSHNAKFGAPQKNTFKNVSAKFNPTNQGRGNQMNLFKNLNSSNPKPWTKGSSHVAEVAVEERLPTLDYKDVLKEDSSSRSKLSRGPVDVSTPYDITRKIANAGDLPGTDNSRAMFMKKPVSIPVNNKPVGEPCNNFRLDINGKFHGDCVCGFSKMAHKTNTVFESDKVNNSYQANLQAVRSNLGGSHVEEPKSKFGGALPKPEKFNPGPKKPKYGNSFGGGDVKQVSGNRVGELRKQFGSGGVTNAAMRTSDPGKLKICPACKARSNKKFCGECGAKLQ